MTPQNNLALKKDSKIPKRPVELRAKSVRALLCEHVRGYVLGCSDEVSIRTAWDMVYNEFNFRYQFNVKAHARRSGFGELDCVELWRLMGELYDVAREVLVHKKARVTGLVDV